MKRLAVIVGIVCFAAICPAALTSIPVDEMTSLRNWEATGRRINYTLGDTKLAVSSESPPGASGSLALTYDFSINWRGWLGMQWKGGPIPGICSELSFQVRGDGSGHGLRVRLLDATGASYERRLEPLEDPMWREVQVSLDAPDDWRQLPRYAETRHPMVFPITLDSIGVTQEPGGPSEGTILVTDLRADSDIEPVDRLDITVDPAVEPAVFYLPQPALFATRVTNPSQAKVTGKLTLDITDFWGQTDRAFAEPVALEPGETLERPLVIKVDRLGTYDAKLKITAGERERTRRFRFSVSREHSPRAVDRASRFGVMCFIAGFPPGPVREQALKLCAEAGVRWERAGFNWNGLEPTKGAFVWQAPARIDGPAGRAVEFPPGACQFAVLSSPALNAPAKRGELSIELRIRLPQLDLSSEWHTVLMKQLASAASREFYIYYQASTRRFALSSGDQDRSWSDAACDRDDWQPGRWYHLMVTHRAGGETRWYVDGEPSGVAQATLPTLLPTDGPLRIGPSPTGFAFALDDLRIYDHVLSQGQAATRAQGRRIEPEPVAHYEFEDEGDVITDGVGGSHGTVAQANIDGVVADCARRGISVLGLLGFPPRWASTAPPEAERFSQHEPDAAAFEAYCREVAGRYKGRVDHWEIWNEPNISVFWEPAPDAVAYARTLAAGYRGCKAGNPDCSVLGVSLAGGAWPALQFVDDVFAAPGGSDMDMLSLHPYRQPRTPEDTDLAGDMRDAFEITRKYDAGKRLWLTEIGWPTELGARGSSERWEALMVPRSFIEAFAGGAVDKVFWFRLHDGGWDPSYMEHNTGLLKHDLSPKPAYFAYRSMALTLAGQDLEQRIDAGPNVRAYLFKGGDARTLAVWAPQEPVPVAAVTSQPSITCVDLMGNPHTVPTRQSVALLKAGPAVQYITDAPTDLRVMAAAALEPSMVTIGRGETAQVALKLANPTRVRQSVSLSAQAPEGVQVQVPDRCASPAGGEARVQVRVQADEDAPAGRIRVALKVESAVGSFELGLPVVVTRARRDAPPVVLLHFDEGAGSTALNSGSMGLEAALRDGARLSPAGKHRGCLELPQVASRAEMPHAEALNIADEVTLMCWVRSPGPNEQWQSPIMKAIGERLRNYGVYLSLQTGEVHFTTTFEDMGEGHADPGCDRAVWDGQWHHIAVTFSKYEQRLRLYVDGEQIDEHRPDQGGLMSAPAPLMIGQGMGGPGPDNARRGPAFLDEVAIYPRALSAEEVKAAAR